MRRPARRLRGAVYVELLIVLVPLLIFVLALIQTALMYVGRLAVQRSANAAVRAAVVILDDDPRHYNGAPRNSVAPWSSRAIDPVTMFNTWLLLPPAAAFASGDSPRLQDIRAAAAQPLLAVSPSLGAVIGDKSVYRAIGGDGSDTVGAGAALYARAAVAVSFPTAPGAASYRTTFRRDEPVTVRVTYLFHCGVPLVRHLMCESVPSLRAGTSLDAAYGAAEATTPAEVAAAVRRLRIRSERIARWHTSELDNAEAPWLIDLTAPAGARYFVMSSEATLPNQGASYSYGGAP